jgi:shikimate kinase
MGAGKSTIGKLLASILSLPFVDSDRVIEERTGADIPWIFDVEGEEGFRLRESSVLEDILNGPSVVLATGGGAVIKEENQKIMSAKGTVFYLMASVEQLLERTSKDKKRPLLQVDNPEEKIKELIAARDQMYQSVADFIVKTDRRSPRSVAQEIAGHL